MDYTLITKKGQKIDFFTSDTLYDIRMDLTNFVFYQLELMDHTEMIIRCSAVEAVIERKELKCEV